MQQRNSLGGPLALRADARPRHLQHRALACTAGAAEERVVARRRDQHGIDAERVRRTERAADVGIVANILEHGNAASAGEQLRGIEQRGALERGHGAAHDFVAGDLGKQRVGNAQRRAVGVLREQLASKRRGVISPRLAYQKGARADAGLDGRRDDRARLRHEQTGGHVGPSSQIGIAHTRIRRQTCIVNAGQMLIRHRVVLSLPGVCSKAIASPARAEQSRGSASCKARAGRGLRCGEPIAAAEFD